MKFAWLILVFLLFSFSCRRKPSVETPVFSRDIFIARLLYPVSAQFPYRVYVPKDRKAGERLPVMLYLHGSDERGSDNESQLSGLASLIQEHPENFPFIVVFPQCPAGRFWDSGMIGAAMAELDQTVTEFDGDESRLYLAGFSLGGYGAWTTAAMYPNKFAAVMPMSGRLVPRPAERKSVAPEILQLVDAADPYAAFAGKLKNIPIWVFHGANDPIVPVENSRQMARALKEAGNQNFKYTELESTGHVSLNAAFSDPKLLEWLMEQRLKGDRAEELPGRSQAGTAMQSFSKF